MNRSAPLSEDVKEFCQIVFGATMLKCYGPDGDNSIGCWDPDGTLRIIDRMKYIFKLSQRKYVAPKKIGGVYIKSPLIPQVFVHGDSLENYSSFLNSISLRCGRKPRTSRRRLKSCALRIRLLAPS
ncbi:hypothetical protein PR003_g30930 [Phytophthora rubi]|nr:hypothetical protein PR002_g29731 [Phytophthora rubi]KAE9270125.1 hypothetical protein PR003_g30930 [Phytophthora rubi]